MLQFEELKLELTGMEPELLDLAEALDLTGMEQEVARLEEEAAQPAFWDDMENSKKVLRQTSNLKNKIAAYNSLKSLYEDTLTLIELADEEEDLSLLPDAQADFDRFKKELETQRLTTLLNGEYDQNNAILTFHAGAGGTEAQDWAEMLYRMYCRWGERHGYNVKTLDYLDGEEAGLKSAVVLIEGTDAYGFLKGESGVHRLVRVSPFDSSGRRHTSFSSLEVMP